MADLLALATRPRDGRLFEQPIRKRELRFYSEELRGVKEMQPRWKRVVAVMDGQMGEALGKIYVENTSRPARQKADGRIGEEP